MLVCIHIRTRVITESLSCVVDALCFVEACFLIDLNCNFCMVHNTYECTYVHT